MCHRLGQVDSARKHLCFLGRPSDPMELHKLEAVEKHLSKCADARRVGDWKTVLTEVDAAIVSGADFSPQVRIKLCGIKMFSYMKNQNYIFLKLLCLESAVIYV